MFVEKAFLINLNIRPDRHTEFKSRYPNPLFLPEIEVWPAVHGDTCQPPSNWASGAGAWGCYRSHLNILEYCMNNNIHSYIVFEDDAQFRLNFNDYTEKVFQHLPEDWQQLYLGGQLLHEHRHAPIKVNEYVYQPYNVNRTHCFAVSQSGMLPIYKHITNLPFLGGEHIDHHLGRLHETFQFQVFCPGKWSVGQGGSSSNVSGKKDPINYWNDPETLANDHWLCQNPICIVLESNLEIRKAIPELHSGYNQDNVGYDRGLTDAAKYKNPIPEINRWYSYVRSEVIRSKGKLKYPCLHHPRITKDMLEGVAFTPLYISGSTIEEIREQIEEKVRL